MAAVNISTELKLLKEELSKVKLASAEKDKLIIELIAENKKLREENLKIREQLDNLLRHQFGQRSEKHLPQDDESSSEDEQDENLDIEFETITYERKKRCNRKNKLSKELPRQPVYYDLPHDLRICSCGCDKALRKIGEEITEQLVIVPEYSYVRQHIRFKYGGCLYDSNIITAPMLPQPIDRGLSSPEIIAHTAINKYEDHLPLYRQEKRYKRYGIDMSRQTLYDWLSAGARWGKLIVERMKELSLKAPIFNTDDTPVQVLSPGNKKTKTGRLWVYAGHGGESIPYIIYEYTENRKSDSPVNFFQGYTGYIQADAYPGYNSLFILNDPTKDRISQGKALEVGCWMHARRGFYKVAKNTKKKGLAYDAVQFIKKLYKIEKYAVDKKLGMDQKQAILPYTGHSNTI